jgi:hypothetical protein
MDVVDKTLLAKWKKTTHVERVKQPVHTSTPKSVWEIKI